MQKPVQMAIIGAAHGIRGEVRVRSFTGDPLALGDYGPLSDKGGRSFVVEAIRPAGTVVIVRFKGVSDRNAAEVLNGTALYVDRSALPDDDDEDAFYHADLVGLVVRTAGGETIGKVTAVQNFGGGDLLEIVHRGQPGVLIPFTQAAVPAVDVTAGSVTVDPVAAGLVDDGEGEAEDDAGPGEPNRPRGPRNAGGNR